MKKILYTLLAGAMALVSCSKSDNMPTATQGESTTFTLAVDAAETRATSTVALTRYVMEVWSEDGTTAENVFENNTRNYAEILATPNGTFTVNLDKTKAYTCLFWADDASNNTAGAFNATSLKAISINTGKFATEAYYAKVAVAKGWNPTVAVTLKRAVAKINLIETLGVQPSDDLTLTLSNCYPTFNVLTGVASGTAADWTKTVKPTAAKGTIGTFYFFAKTTKELSTLKFNYAGLVEKTINNIPVQQNFVTNLKGEYSNSSSFTFRVNADNEWNTPGDEVEFLPQVKVGDYYYSDKTFSTSFYATKTCIGIVFEVNADLKSGMIVGLTEPAANWNGGTNGEGMLYWCNRSVENQTLINASNRTDGAQNMTTVKAISNWQSYYYAFAWAESLNNSVSAGICWYLPAPKEWRQLYAAMCGLKLVDSGADTSKNEVNDWGITDHGMSFAHNYEAARNAFNTKFTTASGTSITLNGDYWSSCEYDRKNAHNVSINNGAQVPYAPKFNSGRVRVISKF